MRVKTVVEQALTVNREKVTVGRQQSRVRDFVQCHGVLPAIAAYRGYICTILVSTTL